MKKSFIFVATLLLAFTSSCLTSKYTAGEPKDQVEDDKIVGTWTYQVPKEEKGKDNPFNEAIGIITFAKASGKGYTFTMPPSPQQAEKGETMPPAPVLIHKIQGENFLSIYNENKEKPEETGYFYMKYKIEGKKLTLYPLVEAKAVKDKKNFEMGKDKPTKFANEKAFRAMIAKNVKGASQNINTKEPLIYTAQ